MNSLFGRKQLNQLIAAQFREILREPGVLFWGIVFPILMSLGLGIAFTQKIDTTRKIAIIERNVSDSPVHFETSQIDEFLRSNAEKIISTDDTSASYKIVLPDDKLGNTTFIFYRIPWQNAMVLLKRGNLNVVIDESDGQIQYHFDPRNPDAQLTYLKLSKLLSNTVTDIKSNQNIRPLTVSGTRYIDFLVPGLIAMGVMMSSLWGISWGIIEKRSKKLLRRLVATPMKKSYFLVSLITARFTMNFVESALLFLFSFIVFGITIQGSVAALLAVFISGNIAFAGIAIFISSHTAKTEIGNGFINVVVMPMMVLSGIFFSYHNFPDWAIPFIQLLPLTMLADGLRSIFIEGAGFAEMILPATVMTAIGVILFTVGLKIFKWH
jgi:ABC-type multidrug transport system permease subunit